jgi:hypothetical protein
MGLLEVVKFVFLLDVVNSRMENIPLGRLRHGFLADTAMAWKLGLKLSEDLSITEEA